MEVQNCAIVELCTLPICITYVWVDSKFDKDKFTSIHCMFNVKFLSDENIKIKVYYDKPLQYLVLNLRYINIFSCSLGYIYW